MPDSRSATPHLLIPAGTRFGYHTGLPWSRRPRPLVEAPEDLSVGSGLHLFVAPNGAGKTTLMRSLAGLMLPLQGKVKAEGQIHYFSDDLRCDPEIKPAALFRSWFKGEALKYALELADKLRLNVKCPIGKLSRGNRQKVLLILAETEVAFSDASLLFMDEPLSGLDREMREVVTDLWAAGKPNVLRLIIIHELESVHEADSLITIAQGKLRHARERAGASWLETYRSLHA
jgi:ABC-2 type transport system ATP-binding protein/manganese/iron transport system ATP-binding protein